MDLDAQDLGHCGRQRLIAVKEIEEAAREQPVVVSLVAAFMSTVSTAVNWGASYLTHDLYQRFMRPAASQRERLLVGQMASVLLVAAVVAAIAVLRAHREPGDG